MSIKIKSRIKQFIGFVSFLTLTIGLALLLALYAISHSLFNVSDADYHFMNLAYKEGILAKESKDYPVGAILVVNGSIVAKDHNRVKLNKDERDHAEMLVIKEALRVLGKSDFEGMKNVTLYTTYEPCAMCEGFIVWKKIPRVVVGKKKGLWQLIRRNYLGHFSYRFNERAGVCEIK
jgi:tRNA(Arg) A34 adenosine deaminase TadA